jgi:hypothetical protein
MVSGLDSATPPSATQVAAAKAAGITLWSGYLASRPELGVGPVGSRFGLFRPWRQPEFAVVKALSGTPLAYASGWDDPAGCKALAAAWGVRLCLDVEAGIRGDGAWVQPWLDASSAGLYGTRYVHAPLRGPARRAAFHIAAFYPTPMVDPHATWPAGWTPPGTPCGWQWWNSHNEFGVTVDRSWLDDSFGGSDVTIDDVYTLLDAMNKQTLARIEAKIDAVNTTTLKRMEDEILALKAPTAPAVPSAPFDATITPK